VSASDEQREAEMARGREIAARHANTPKRTLEDRQELLARYESIVLPKSGLMVTAAGHYPFRICYEGKNKVAKIEGETIAAEVYGPAWPSDTFVAQCALAVSALIPSEFVPDYSAARQAQINERKRRDEARKHIIDWKKHPNGI
jgi:hypothetical protein